MKKYGALTLVRNTIELRESLDDGVILVEHAAQRNWYMCDCGKEISFWYKEIKGKEVSLLKDCGCGILAKREAEKQVSDIAVMEQLERPRMRSGSRGGKAMRAFNMDLALLIKLDEYAEQLGDSPSQALCQIVEEFFVRLKAGAK